MNGWTNAPLRRRLTLLYAGLLAVLLIALSGVIYVETREFLLASTALRQRAQAKPVIDRWIEETAERGPPPWAGALPPWAGPAEGTPWAGADRPAPPWATYYPEWQGGGPPPWAGGPPPWAAGAQETPAAEDDESAPPWATYFPEWQGGPPPWAGSRRGEVPASPTASEATPPAMPTAVETMPMATPVLVDGTPAPSPATVGPPRGDQPRPLTPDDIVQIAPTLSWELTSRDTTATILDRRGEWVADGGWWTAAPATAPLDPNRVAEALSGDEVTYTAEVNGRETLVTLIPLRSELNDPEVLGVVQLSTPLTIANDVLGRERLLLGVGVLLTIVLGAAGALWLTTSTLRPLRHMVGACRRIAAGSLGERVNLPHRQDEVGQLAAAFDDMAERIEAAFAAQRRFVADAAHELRTPLNSLNGSVEVLLRGAQDDPATANRLIQGMHRELTRLSRLAAQLLDLSRLEMPTTVHLQPLTLPAYIEENAPRLQVLARHRIVRLEPGPVARFDADPDLLQQMLLNLVDNAAQHTAEGGEIRIGWRASADRVEIRVADDGEGIEPDDLPHVFEPFYRGDRARSRRRGGTGLGLALVQSIVEAHGGKVQVDSRPNQGARFTISLPVDAGASSHGRAGGGIGRGTERLS